MKRRTFSSRGFTLIEVMAALALMGVVLPVAMRGVSIALMAASQARDLSQASTLGQAKLNEIVQMYLLADPTAGNTSGDFGQEYPAYQWACQATDDTTFGVTHLTLSVSWVARGQPRDLTFSTLVVTPQ